MTIFSSTQKSATTFGSRALLVGALGAFAGSAWALPPAPMAVDPIDPAGCVIYATNQAGPFTKFTVKTPGKSDEFPANVCSEGSILPGAGIFNAPKGNTPNYETYNTVALAAAAIINLNTSSGNTVLETHTVDAASLILDNLGAAKPAVATRFFDITGTSFPGPGIAFPVFTSTGVDGDIVCNSGGTVDVHPGNYGIMDVRKCTVNWIPDPDPTVPSVYIFKSINSNSTRHVFTAKTDDKQPTQIMVEDYVAHGHPAGAFNKEHVPEVTVWIKGTDGSYGGNNTNNLSDVTGEPAVFENGGDSPYFACHVYAKNGTISVRGHSNMFARLLGVNVQKLGGLNAKLTHPQEICGQIVTPQCMIINSLECEGAGPLVLKGEGLVEGNIRALTVYDEASGGSIAALLGNPVSAATASVLGGALNFPDPLMSEVEANLSDFALADGTVTTFVGVIGPNTGAPPTSSGFYIKSNQRLKLTTVAGATTCEVLTP